MKTPVEPSVEPQGMEKTVDERQGQQRLVQRQSLPAECEHPVAALRQLAG
jgi:hypothetical protein